MVLLEYYGAHKILYFLSTSWLVCSLDSGLGSLGSFPGRGHCVVFLCKTLGSHSASLHPGVQMVTGELNAGGNPAMD